MRRSEKIVYKSTNNINGKIYIGWCIDFKERINRHYNNSKKGKNTHFYNAIRKYGKDNFSWEILFEDLKSYDECKRIEVKMIDKYDTYYNGYNSTKGGDGGDTYSKLTEERKYEFRKKCSENNNKYWLGKKFDKEYIEKLKKADRSKSYKPVIQLTKEGDVIKEWESVKSASSSLKLTHISCVCNGKRNSCGGYMWKYKNKI